MREGQYYYAPHRGKWGVWKKGREENGVSSDEFVADFFTKIQASNFVYKCNKWTNKSQEG